MLYCFRRTRAMSSTMSVTYNSLPSPLSLTWDTSFYFCSSPQKKYIDVPIIDPIPTLLKEVFLPWIMFVFVEELFQKCSKIFSKAFVDMSGEKWIVLGTTATTNFLLFAVDMRLMKRYRTVAIGGQWSLPVHCSDRRSESDMEVHRISHSTHPLDNEAT